MANLPDPKSIPGMEDLLKHIDPSLILLENDPNVSWEIKLAALDIKLIDMVSIGNLEAFGRLVEFREAVVQERFVLTPDYIVERNGIVNEYEPKEVQLLKIGNEPGARRTQFEKYRLLFKIQEQFIARNYPVKFLVKERLRGWKDKTSP